MRLRAKARNVHVYLVNIVHTKNVQYVLYVRVYLYVFLCDQFASILCLCCCSVLSVFVISFCYIIATYRPVLYGQAFFTNSSPITLTSWRSTTFSMNYGLRCSIETLLSYRWNMAAYLNLLKKSLRFDKFTVKIMIVNRLTKMKYVLTKCLKKMRRIKSKTLRNFTRVNIWLREKLSND